MTDLVKRLAALGFKPDRDYVVQDDGEGPYIKVWLSQASRPNQTAIDRVTTKAITDATELQAFQAMFDTDRKDKALIQWIGTRTGGNALQWMDELFTIWKSIT